MARTGYSDRFSLKSTYRIVKKHPIMSGIVLVLLGIMMGVMAISANSELGTSISGTVMALGLVVAYLGMGNWYCQNCGQRLGKIKPRHCKRCDSNRIQKRDPGVGEAVRVKRQR